MKNVNWIFVTRYNCPVSHSIKTSLFYQYEGDPKRTRIFVIQNLLINFFTKFRQSPSKYSLLDTMHLSSLFPTVWSTSRTQQFWYCSVFKTFLTECFFDSVSEKEQLKSAGQATTHACPFWNFVDRETTILVYFSTDFFNFFIVSRY